ncbi:hypothetical protein [Haloglomus salinum]|jgi:peptidoglycan hydrolase CwlO-like protein|uniref:hypothetical protein n=1 Tax=Haloglomus salinum TaxID=2962673 RepID=UPI0020CA211A|nr:hypothetical protein [Haloglomus salinum]
MESGDGGSDGGELQPIVDKLAAAAREAHTELCTELPSPEARTGKTQADVTELREGIETTQQYIRQLEQYIVALEEQVDEGE